MADQIADNFLTSYFKTIGAAQEQKQFQAEQQFKQAQLQAQMQEAQQRIGIEKQRADSEDLFRQATLKGENDRFAQTQAAQNAERAFTLQAQGLGTPVQPNFQSAGPAMGMGQLPAVPGLTAPAPLAGAQPTDPATQATAVAPPGAQQFGQSFLQPTTPEERAATSNRAKADAFDKAIAGANLSPLAQQRAQIARAGILSGTGDVDSLVKSILPEGKVPTEAETPLGAARVAQLNQGITQQYQALNPGQKPPDSLLLHPEATVGDYNRLDGQIKNIISTKGVQAQREATNKLANDRLEDQHKQASLKVWQPTLDASQRLNIMTQNYQDAIKGDQQAQLSLLAHHLGLTVGADKNFRITQTILDEAIKSRPYLQGLKSKFDKDGYLSGVTLTKPQMQQMLEQGRVTYAQTAQKSKSANDLLGLENEPNRRASTSTKMFYLEKYDHDPAKAKAAAAADGWSPD